jgi:hypothetical protein
VDHGLWDPIVSGAMVFAEKKDGGKRYFQDYRDLNANTENNPYKIKNMDKLLGRGGGRRKYGS